MRRRGDRARRARRSAAASPSSAARSPSRASTTRSGSRCRRAARRRSRSSGRSSAAPSWSSSGAATAWCSAASTRSPASRRRSRSSPPAPRTCSRRTSASRRTSSGAVEIGLARRSAGKLDVGRLNGERFAVMAGAGFDAPHDPRRRRRAEGSARSRRLRLDAARATCGKSRSTPRSRSTAELVQGQGELRPRRQRRQALRRRRGVRRTRSRPTEGSSSACHRRGPGAVDAHAGAHRRRHAAASPFVETTSARKIRIKLDRRCATSSTAATATRSAACASTSSPARSRSACPELPLVVATAAPVIRRRRPLLWPRAMSSRSVVADAESPAFAVVAATGGSGLGAGSPSVVRLHGERPLQTRCPAHRACDRERREPRRREPRSTSPAGSASLDRPARGPRTEPHRRGPRSCRP